MGDRFATGSSVGIATDDGLDGRGSIPGKSKSFSLLPSFQTGCGAHPASYPLGSLGSFPEGKAAGAWSWPLPSSA
jgi:hypothetical protein